MPGGIGLSGLSQQLEEIADQQARMAREVARMAMPSHSAKELWTLATDNMINAGNLATTFREMGRLRIRAVEICLEWAPPGISRQALARLTCLPLTPAHKAEAIRLEGLIVEATRQSKR